MTIHGAIPFLALGAAVAGTITRDMLPPFAVVLAAMSIPVLLGARLSARCIKG